MLKKILRFCLLLLACTTLEARPKICLTMLVENDEEVILPCLQSVLEIVDCLCICDIGSKDNTLELIEEFMTETGVEGKFYKQKFRDYATNRNLSVQTAKKMLDSYGVPLEDAYLLILDPGALLKISPNFDPNSLTKDGYSLLEKSAPLSYYHYAPHLLRASLPWKSKGTVFEEWMLTDKYEMEKLSTIMIDAQEDTEYNRNKLIHAATLLHSAHEVDPENPRTLFLLGQTYKNLKEYDEAIEWYLKRLQLSGDKEETWFTKYMIGETFELNNQWGHALYWYLEAFQTYPERPDTLKRIATFYRTHGQNDLAYIFARHGARIPFPSNDTLFSCPPLYDYQFEEELSIIAYYTNFRGEGHAAANDLVLRKHVPWWIKDQSYYNMLFYIDHLPDATYQSIDLDFPPICEESNELFHPMNPSICKTEEGYAVICRTVNYTQTGAKYFNTIDPSGVFKTRNFLAHYDKDLNLLSQHEITEDLPRDRVRAFNLEGLDDCRIFQMDGEYWFTCNTGDTNPCGTMQISLCQLANRPLRKTIPVETLVPLHGPELCRCEKNWLPFLMNGELHVVYSYDPFIIYKPDLYTGECETVVHYETEHDFTRFRGSAAPIPFDNGYLLLVHEVIHLPDYQRNYLHRFVYLDKDFRIQQVSRTFLFRHVGIEFCCAMTYDHSGKNLILPIGIEDREAYLCTVPVDTVRSLLHPLPTLGKLPLHHIE
ncbi:MAG: hypothetical protein JSS61_02510 [Verrucomicrobia bacterium]|nr:hypothetical protein [Verrucomicrobiota bacterium]